MSKATRALATAFALLLAVAAPAAAQSARAAMTASATVVEPIGLMAGPSTVSSMRGAIDVTTPVSVRGRAAHVMQVIRASDATPNVRASVQGRGAQTRANGATSSAYDVRLRVARATAAAGPAAVTYVISTLN
ncbi:MAG TPA: hypothetical protein VFS20_05690 [Longimicrobium sp.]|nr:hypothetical protein [Longimicrobium sp.]